MLWINVLQSVFNEVVICHWSHDSKFINKISKHSVKWPNDFFFSVGYTVNEFIAQPNRLGLIAVNLSFSDED